MEGNCFRFAPPFKHQGQNEFNPMLAEVLEHQKALLVCRPWRLTTAQVVPFLIELVEVGMELFQGLHEGLLLALDPGL